MKSWADFFITPRCIDTKVFEGLVRPQFICGQSFSGVFKGFKMEALATNRLIILPELLQRDRRIEN